MSKNGGNEFERWKMLQVSSFDQGLQEHKAFYEGLKADDRARYRKELARVAKAQSLVDGINPGAVKFYMSACIINPHLANSDEIYINTASLSVVPVLDAWNSWGKAREFAPSWLGTL